MNRGSLAKRPLDRSEISICIFIQKGFYLNSVPLFTVNKAFYANRTGRTQMRKILPRAVIVSETIRKQKFKTFIMQPIREKLLLLEFAIIDVLIEFKLKCLIKH